jgi:predicted nucleic-acid-binding protein
MIGLDTNILVRYFAQDDASQSALANKLVASLSKDVPGFVSLIVLCELVWVLEDAYGMSKSRIVEILTGLMQADELSIENKVAAWAALISFRSATHDFSDALIMEIGKRQGCRHTVTFDKAAAKAEGFVLLKGR